MFNSRNEYNIIIIREIKSIKSNVIFGASRYIKITIDRVL